MRRTAVGATGEWVLDTYERVLAYVHTIFHLAGAWRALGTFYWLARDSLPSKAAGSTYARHYFFQRARPTDVEQMP